MTVNDVAEAVRDGKLVRLSLEDLREAQRIAYNWYAGHPNNSQAFLANEAIRSELAAREMKAHQDRLHPAAMEKHAELHGAIVKLQKPHWTLTPNFWIAFGAFVCAAIAAVPVVQSWIPKPAPAQKAASIQPLQSNSSPVLPATTRTSPPVVLKASPTNQPQK